MSIKRIWQILMTVTICCAFTACGDDKKDAPETPGNTDKSLNYANVNYSIELPQDVVDLWDVEVRYTDVNGETKVEQMGSRSSWSTSVTWNTETTKLESIPEEVTMSVVGKPKATAVTLDPDKAYKIGKVYKMIVSLTYNNGQKGGDQASSGSSYSASGSKLTEAVKKDFEILPEISLRIPREYTK